MQRGLSRLHAATQSKNLAKETGKVKGGKEKLRKELEVQRKLDL